MVLGVLGCVLVWLSTKVGFSIFGKLPPLFDVTIPMMGFGIALIPLVCLPILLAMAMAVIVFRAKSRPYTIILFFGLQPALLVTDVFFWGNAIRLIAAMLLSSILLNLEVLYRRLRREQIHVGIASLVVTAAWYVAAACICAAASV